MFSACHREWALRGRYSANPFEYLQRFLLALKSQGEFVTASDILNGAYPRDVPCFMIDHHIDFYPLETQHLLEWEINNGIKSCVYIFNEFDGREYPAQGDWSVSDLNIPLLSRAEANGCEIGYHVNAVGLAKARAGKTKDRYAKSLSPDIIREARHQFTVDVNNLRRHFDIRTAIPHGGGEGNNLVDLGYEGLELTPVYNARKLEAQPQSTWRNFSDSTGKFYSKFNYGKAVYLSSQDRLGVAASLLEPKLYHFLFHAGRFGRGMAYEEGEYNRLEIRADVKESKECGSINVNKTDHWILSDNPETLFSAMRDGASSKLCYLRRERYTAEHRLNLRPPRPIVREITYPTTLENFLNEPYWHDQLFFRRDADLDRYVNSLSSYDIV